MINCIVVTDSIFSCQSNPQAERFTFGSDDMRSGRHGYGYGRDGGYRASSARQGYDYGRGYGEYRGYGEDRGYGDDRGYGEDRGYGVGFRGYGHHNGGTSQGHGQNGRHGGYNRNQPKPYYPSLVSPMDRGEVPPYVEHHGAPDDRSVSPLTASQYHDASAFHCKGGTVEGPIQHTTQIGP